MSKLVNLSDEVYSMLTKLKGSMSYSLLIKGMLEKRSNKEAILSFAGKGGIDEKEISKLKRDWKKWSMKYA